MTIALIDGDTIAFRCAASCEPTKEKPNRESREEAILRADQLLYRILDACQTQEHRIFISGSDNFRYAIYPDYKANRLGKPRPEHLDAVRDFLVREWGAEIVSGCEADDGIGIAAKEDFIICSNDKDFRQIQGRIFNWTTDEFETVDEYDAALHFYSHLLIGDRSDNVRGVDGIGPVKARRLLDGRAPEEMEDIVREAFADDERYFLTLRLLRIVRSEEELNEIYENILSEGKGKEVTATGS